MHDKPLTPAQRLYLEAFDNLLMARTRGEGLAARDLMSERLSFVLAEKRMPLPEETRWRDSLAWKRKR